MRESKERIVEDKRQDILDQIRKKNESSSKILDKARIERENRLIKMNKTMQTDRSIKSKMDEKFKKFENERIEIEKMVENKCKKLYNENFEIKSRNIYSVSFLYFNFIVSLYSQNNQDHLNNLKQRFSQRISESVENFNINMKSVKEKMDQKIKDDEQKMIDKFEKWV